MSDFRSSILVATDGSEDAALAVRAAADLSNRTGSELHVVHAWRRPTFLGLSLEKATEGSSYAHEEAERLLEEQAEHTRAGGGIVAGAHLREGRPAEEIVELAGELGVGLVVIGSRGLGAVKRLIVGSVSEGVVDFAPCPTLVVRGGEEVWPPSRLVVGDDGSEEARRAGELAAGVGKLFDARVLLVRVYPSVSVFKARRIVHMQASGEVLKRGESSLEERAAELEGVLGMRPETRVASGDAAAVLQEMAEEGARPALVAVGRRGLGSVRYSTLGGVSADVLRSVAGPVLIVPSPREGSGRAYNDPREE
ncbi:MAG: universal stress protein [Actinomycetota bacterium]|nr:universal stress protein [Actinomycetota bacterium]